MVIPAYNEAASIGDCLDSLLRQDFSEPYEIIVVDNNSTDDTTPAAKARGVTVVREERQGVCWARQLGSELAAGEIIISTDADTTYGRDWLSRIDREFRADPAPVAAAGPFQFVDAPWWGRVWTGALFGYVHAFSRATKRVPYVAAANIAFLKSAWPGYNTYATQGGDELDLLRNLQARGRVAYMADNPVFTSSRRLSRGLVYNVFVTLFYYYALAYVLNRVMSRTMVGMAPAFRGGPSGKTARPWIRVASAFGALIVVAAIFPYHHVIMHHLDAYHHGILRHFDIDM
ncbi:MAG: glycosyltransferase family 2 protein [Streptosporangiales bacterium]|nr:glycosyltransferase family 2 protein [Streptosporangiales bacterium]